MTITKYKVLNPIVDYTKPFLDRRGFFNFPVEKDYKYFVECCNIDEDDSNSKTYYLLLGTKQFDENCKKCNVINQMCLILVKGEMRDYIIRESVARGNLIVNRVEDTEEYDVYQII